MRWGRIVGVALGVAAIAGGVLGYVYRDEISVALALRRCESVWAKVDDYQSDFDVHVQVGPLKTSVHGRVAYLRPDSYRLELGSSSTPDCTVYGNKHEASVYFPAAKAVVNVQFEGGELATVLESESPQPWLDQLAHATHIEWGGKDAVDGRSCKVLELVPPSASTESGIAIASPALGSRFADVPFIGDWKRTRIYLDDQTGLPIRGDALQADGDILFTWTATNPEIDRGLLATDFEFQPPRGTRVLQRKYDPEHPERLFLPPSKGRSLLRQLGDAIEEGAKDYLEQQAGKLGGNAGNLGGHIADEMTH